LTWQGEFAKGEELSSVLPEVRNELWGGIGDFRFQAYKIHFSSWQQIEK
jgi:hypothetical protein